MAALAMILSACAPPPGDPGTVQRVDLPQAAKVQTGEQAGLLPLKDAARNFAFVIERVEPVAEALCRAQTSGRNCNFQIWVDTNPEQPANAFQTLDSAGRPQIVFTVALIAEARNPDELAFVLGHEAAHHIEGHIEESQREALTGAIIGGILASGSGASDAAIEKAQQLGAQVGALRFSKQHELEADRLGTVIAYEAGFDPLLGARFFARLPDPGDGFLQSHPANSDRQALIAATYAQISGQQAGN